MKNTFRDIELLSAYLDDQLDSSDSARLESRIQSDPELGAVLQDLSNTRALLRKLPSRRAPRNFILTRKMAGLKSPLPRSYPTFRFASVFATFLLIFTYATNFTVPLVMSRTTVVPVYGSGGGCDSCDTSSAAESALAPEAAATEAPSLMQADSAPATEAPSMESSSKLGIQPTEISPLNNSQPAGGDDGFVPPVEEPAPAPIPDTWQLGLIIIAILSGTIAWISRVVADRKFNKQ